MDWNNMQTWHYFVIIGGIILLLGLVAYFLPVGKIKVPAVITAAFGALGVGLAAGIIFMAGYGYKPVAPVSDGQTDEEGAQQAQSMMLTPKGPAVPGKKGPNPKGKGNFGGFGPPPSPRVELATLVNALETLVDKPVAINLSPEDRAVISKQLEGLDTATSITDDDAKARLDAIQKVLEKDRKALEAIGYRWAGDPKGGGRKGGLPKESQNPFRDGANADRLKSLQERLAKK